LVFLRAQGLDLSFFGFIGTDNKFERTPVSTGNRCGFNNRVAAEVAVAGFRLKAMRLSGHRVKAEPLLPSRRG